MYDISRYLAARCMQLLTRHVMCYRCLDLRFYPSDSAHHLVSAYNNLFQELKLYFIDLHDAKQYKLKNHVEMIAARKEAEKMAAKNKDIVAAPHQGRS